MYQLPKDVLDQVNDMLLNENMKYSDIQYWLETEHNMKISLSSVLAAWAIPEISSSE